VDFIWPRIILLSALDCSRYILNKNKTENSTSEFIEILLYYGAMVFGGGRKCIYKISFFYFIYHAVFVKSDCRTWKENTKIYQFQENYTKTMIFVMILCWYIIDYTHTVCPLILPDRNTVTTTTTSVIVLSNSINLNEYCCECVWEENLENHFVAISCGIDNESTLHRQLHRQFHSILEVNVENMMTILQTCPQNSCLFACDHNSLY